MESNDCPLPSYENTHDRVVLAGHRGYLGNHILQTLVERQIDHLTLDPRRDNFEGNVITNSDLIIDATRIRTFDAKDLVADDLAHHKLRSSVSNASARYLRIGSTLEITPGSKPTPYLTWSASRSNSIRTFSSEIQKQILYVPNIFGGANSLSVVDLLKIHHRTGEGFTLSDPHAFREFLHIDFFLNALLKIIEGKVPAFNESIILTSGFQYRIGDLKDSLISKSLTGTRKESVGHEITGHLLRYPDTVLDYLSSV